MELGFEVDGELPPPFPDVASLYPRRRTQCCDAQHIGSLDGVPERAVQDVPPRVRRFVFRRDGGRCAVPGCRSTANLEIHHLTPRSQGGTHDPSNLCVTCDGCHTAHHRGSIEISGRPGALVVTRRHVFDTHAGADRVDPNIDGEVVTHVGTNANASVAREVPEPASPGLGIHVPRMQAAESRGSSISKLERATMRTQACDALMGFKRHEARTAVEAALADPDTSTLQSLLFEALRSLRPKTG